MQLPELVCAHNYDLNNYVYSYHLNSCTVILWNYIEDFIVILQLIIVTRIAKMYIVHTSNFSTLVTHKILYERQVNVKLAGIVEILVLFLLLKFLYYS